MIIHFSQLTAVVILNQEWDIIYTAPGTINVSLSGDVISDTGYTVNMFEIDGSGLTENYSAYSLQ